MIEALQKFLDKEIKRLERGNRERDAAKEKQIEEQQEAISKNPQDADAYLSLGEIHNSIGEGADAIINTKKAEELFVKKGDIAGTSRRALRNYYKKYAFQPEDFELSGK
jgi:cytochrome c-type biogenesis protein CcmH/NrfG